MPLSLLVGVFLMSDETENTLASITPTWLQLLAVVTTTCLVALMLATVSCSPEASFTPIDITVYGCTAGSASVKLLRSSDDYEIARITITVRN